MKLLKALPPYLIAGFILAWVVVNADQWDPFIAGRDGHLLQLFGQYILLFLAAMGVVAKALRRDHTGGPKGGGSSSLTRSDRASQDWKSKVPPDVLGEPSIFGTEDQP